MANYVAVIHKDRGSDYGVSFPDVPGCVSAGSTVEEAVRGAQDAIASHLALLAEAEEAITPPRSMEEITADPDYADAKYFTYVATALPARVSMQRVNVTLPQDLLAEIDMAGAGIGLKRSPFLAEAARRYIAALNEAASRRMEPGVIEVDKPSRRKGFKIELPERGRKIRRG